MIQQWVSVAEAASELNVSDATIRRRAHQGKLKTRHDKTGRLQVLIQPKDQPKKSSKSKRESTKSSKSDTKAQGDKTNAAQQANNPWFQKSASANSNDTGSKVDPNTKPTMRFAKQSAGKANEAQNTPIPLTPASIELMKATAGNGDTATRFERMAGASLVLAQNQTDQANEKLVIVRGELHRARKVARWAVASAVVAVAVALITLMGSGGNARDAWADAEAYRVIANETRADAKQWEDKMVVAHQELAAAEAQADTYKLQVANTQHLLEDLTRRNASLEAENIQLQKALQNAFSQMSAAQ